jgi:manganese oxidase
LPGDYVYSNQRLPYSQSGQWGYMRVLPSGDNRLQPLGAGGVGSKHAAAEEQPQVVPTAMK